MLSMLVERLGAVFIVALVRGYSPKRSGFAQQQLFFMLLAIALHAAVLCQLPHGVSLHEQHWQAISARFESHRPVQLVSLSSLSSSAATHEPIPAKARQKSHEVAPGMPSAIADTPSASRRELFAAPPPVASAAPVTGLALPQPGVTQGHRPLWAVSSAVSMPDQQTLFQQNQQRNAQLAMQTARVADRGEFETQLKSALQGAQLNSPCRIIVPSAQAARLHCENAADAHAVDAVIKHIGSVPTAQNDAVLIIDLRPGDEGKSQAISRYVDASLLPQIK